MMEKISRTCIPDLCLDALAVDINRTSRKIDTDGRFGFEMKFVARESRDHCVFGVSCDQDPPPFKPVRFLGEEQLVRLRYGTDDGHVRLSDPRVPDENDLEKGYLKPIKIFYGGYTLNR